MGLGLVSAQTRRQKEQRLNRIKASRLARKEASRAQDAPSNEEIPSNVAQQQTVATQIASTAPGSTVAKETGSGLSTQDLPAPKKHARPKYLEPKIPKTSTPLAGETKEPTSALSTTEQKEPNRRSPAGRRPKSKLSTELLSKTVRLRLEGNIESFDEQVFRSAVASRIAVPLESIEVISVVSGSIIVTLALSNLSLQGLRAVRHLEGTLVAGYRVNSCEIITDELSTAAAPSEAEAASAEERTSSVPRRRWSIAKTAVAAAEAIRHPRVSEQELVRIDEMTSSALSVNSKEAPLDDSGGDEDFEGEWCSALVAVEQTGGAALGNAPPPNRATSKPKPSKWLKVKNAVSGADAFREAVKYSQRGSVEHRNEYGAHGTQGSPTKSRLVRIAGKVRCGCGCARSAVYSTH